MKKLNIFILAIAFVISIFVITFFGSAISLQQMAIYINTLQITTYDKDLYEKFNRKYLILQYDPTIENTHRIDIEYGPENATYRNTKPPRFFLVGDTITDDNGIETKKATINKYGELTLLYCLEDGPSTVEVHVETTDGLSNVSDTLTVNWVMKK